MFYQTIQQFTKTLKNLDAILDKATKHAEAKKFDPSNYLTQRLAPDMFPLTRQIQIACDVAKGAAAQLVGKDAPKFEDTEKTMPEVRERIRKTVTYLETFREADFKQVTGQSVVKLSHPVGKGMRAEEYLLSRAVPNFFFHSTTTYALLRAAGVELGKGDFLGQVNTFDL